MKIIRKILFCFNITGDLLSFIRLTANSKKFSLSKSYNISPKKENNYFSINIKFKDVKQTIFLRTYKGDIDIFYEIFQKEIYLAPAEKKDPELIIDLGANIGLSALYFTALFPKARIICVEPGDESYKFLIKNVASQIQARQITTLKAAVMGTDGNVSFSDSKMHYNSKVTASIIKNTEAFSLHTLYKKYNIQSADLIKMDIEGAEKDVFESPDWLYAVKNLIIEMHSEDIMDSCIDKLEKSNFKVKRINADPDNAYLFWASKE
jgi:FkbM family methyltransferase